MIIFDQTLEHLQTYQPRLTHQGDFDAFWKDEIAASKDVPLNVQIKQLEYPIQEVEAFDVFYDGADGTRVNGLWIRPAGRKGQKNPTLIYFHGYTRSKGFIHEYLKWTIQGYNVFAISIRGQGGATADAASYPQGIVTGWMTQGITNPKAYYYKHVYLDGLRAVDFVFAQEETDGDRVGIYGLSQGGGISLAVTALDSRIRFVMPIYPYLCHFEKGVELYQDGPYSEIYEYFRFFDPEMKTKEVVYKTLSYFDGMNFASRIQCPVLMAACLADVVCPPSTVFAAYNHIQSDKSIKIYPHHGHEPLPFHDEAMIEFARRQFAPRE